MADTDQAVAQQPEMSDGQLIEQELRNNGYHDNEIESAKGEITDELTRNNYSPKEIRDFWGIKEPDMSATKAEVQKNLAAAKTEGAEKPKRDPTQPVVAKDIWDAMEAGWGNSVLGLATHGDVSPVQLDKDASMAQTAASGLAQFVGDSPAMAAGFLAGAPAGVAVGGAVANIPGMIGGSVIGAAAGAFGVPQAMRKIMIDHYQKGDIQDAGDFARRVVGATWEGAKGAITGAATAAAGGLGGALAGTAARVASEIGAQTVVSNALEGRLPDRKDFLNGAVAIGGLHAIGYGAGRVGYVSEKLMNIWAETGAHPAEVIEAAHADPALKGELLSANPDLPIEAAPAEKAETPAPPKEPAPPKDSLDDHFLSKIGEQKEPEAPSTAEAARDYVLNKIIKYQDSSLAIKELEKDMASGKLTADQSAHVAMRLFNGVQDKFDQFLNESTYDRATGKPNGEGYMPIINDVKAMGPGALDRFNAYRLAKRTLNLESRGIESGFDPEIARQKVERDQAEMQPLMDRYVAMRNRVVDYVTDSGRYSKEVGQALKDVAGDSYAPLKRILEPDPSTGRMEYQAKDIKKIIGSDRDIVDPYQSDLRDISNMIRLAEETTAKNKFVAAFKDQGEESLVTRSENQSGPAKAAQVEEWVDGKRTLYDAPPQAAEVLNHMAGNQIALDALQGVMRVPAKMLRFGILNNPMFVARHAWRQNLTAPTLSQTGLNIFQSMLYAPEYLEGGDLVKQFKYDGGAVSSIMPKVQDWVDGNIYQLNDKAPFLKQAWNLLQSASEWSHALISNHDNIIRFAEYKRMLEKGATRTESAFAAREVLPDFQTHGLQRSALQVLTAFMDPDIKGQMRNWQAMSKDWGNLKGALNGDEAAGKKFLYGYGMKNLAYMTVPSIILGLAQRNNDKIDDLPGWLKNGYWNIDIPNWRKANSLAEAMSVMSAFPSHARQMPDGSWQVNDSTIYRIQKPFTQGILFGSVVEAGMESWQKNSPKPFEEWAKAVVGSMIPQVTMTSLVPVAEQYFNKNFYTGQPLVRSSMENKVPEMRYKPYTSDTAKLMGHLMSDYVPLTNSIGGKDAPISAPVVFENYVKGWGGSMGAYALDVLDKALQKSGVVPEPVKPVARLDEIPFVKELTVRFNSGNSQQVQDFEERYRMADQVKNSIKQLIKEGDVQGAMHLQDKYAINMARLSGVDKAIQNLNASIQKVYQVPDIDPVEKRQLIDVMTYQLIGMAKQGNLMMDEFEKNVKNKGAGK